MTRDNDEKEYCIVCFDEFYAEPMYQIELKCGHVFHLSCVVKWSTRRNNCPLCIGAMNAITTKEYIIDCMNFAYDNYICFTKYYHKYKTERLLYYCKKLFCMKTRKPRLDELCIDIQDCKRYRQYYYDIYTLNKNLYRVYEQGEIKRYQENYRQRYMDRYEQLYQVPEEQV